MPKIKITFINNFRLLLINIFFIFTIFGSNNFVIAQETQPTSVGKVSGVVMDTVNNYAVQSATVSVYKAADNTLLNYQITNVYGEFSIKNLPLEMSLKIVITSIAYSPYSKTFSISSKTKQIELDKIVINPSDILLETVKISIPPISMNGDTLEFNAAAFNLDSNAVIEDMLRKLENVTLWGDGKITVNGKEIKSILVNGKQFFGNDAKIAMQNIPKNSLQKVQVYNKLDFNPSNPLDSVMEMNFKLKKGMDLGYFGKVGFGLGTDHRYEADMNLNFFTSKMQVSIFGASNNVNKLAEDAKMLIENSSFKGLGNNVSYQPDFRIYGINRPKTTGFKFNYNFIDKPDSYKNNEIDAEYFLQNINVDSVSNLQSTTSLNQGSQIFDRNESTSFKRNFTQKISTEYNLKKNDHNLQINQQAMIANNSNKNTVLRTSENNQSDLISTNNTLGQNETNSNYYDLILDYNYPSKSGKTFGGIITKYIFGIKNVENDLEEITNFRSFINPALNQQFNRNYHTETNDFRHMLEFEFINLRKLFFPNKKLLGINLSISNKTIANMEKKFDRVLDFDNLTETYVNNSYLTNKVHVNTIEEIPGLNFTKSIVKNLSNRFNKNLIMNISAKQLFISQNIRSIKDFQRFRLNYKRFIPELKINYKEDIYGEYERNYFLGYNTIVKIPNLQQLAPLTDSSNVYNLLRGNIKLRESVEKVVAANFSNEDQSKINTLNYNASITVGQITNAIVDSVFIDNQNRRTIFKANVDGQRYVRFSGEIEKALKFKDSEIQISFNPIINFLKSPSYINNVFLISNNFNSSLILKINYRLKDFLLVETEQSYSSYKSTQSALGIEYNGKNLASALSISSNINKKIIVGSNVTFNSSRAVGANNVDFTIWNANVVYRFLKGNNLEFKFSALDLLRQNNSVVNYSDANSFTIGTRNVLQNYYMTSISYYPRHFGKRKSKL